MFTWVSPHTGERDTLVTVDFLPRDKRTEVVVTHEQLPEEKREAHNGGWTRALEKLDAVSRIGPRIRSELSCQTFGSPRSDGYRLSPRAW